METINCIPLKWLIVKVLHYYYSTGIDFHQDSIIFILRRDAFSVIRPTARREEAAHLVYETAGEESEILCHWCIPPRHTSVSSCFLFTSSYLRIYYNIMVCILNAVVTWVGWVLIQVPYSHKCTVTPASDRIEYTAHLIMVTCTMQSTIDNNNMVYLFYL